MNEAVQKYLQAASGLTNLTKARAETIAKQLVKQGEAATDNVGELVDDLLDRQRKNREAVTALVKAETQRAVRAMGLATTTEVERLHKQVADLKRDLAKVESSGAAKTSGKKATSSSAKKSSTAKKSSGKKSSTAKKSTAKKSTAKKSTAKKSSGKKSSS
jgi:polyhydroxyalkanoate synthesis regulator phasin